MAKTIVAVVKGSTKPSDKELDAHVRKAIEMAGGLKGIVKKGDTVIRIDRHYFRPTEVDHLIADAMKAKKRLDWSSRVTFEDLTKIMVDADMRAAGLEPVGEGDAVIRKKFPRKWWVRD